MRVSFSDDVGESALLDPSEPRFGWALTITPGPTERFKPIPNVVPLPYKLDVGTGKNVGVLGREDGVGMVLMVAVVLWLSPERRECGLRLLIVLRAREFGLGNVGEDADAGIPLRKELGAEGLDTRLRSFSASFAGEGVSSIMRTHPDLLGSGVVAPLFGGEASALCLC